MLLKLLSVLNFNLRAEHVSHAPISILFNFIFDQTKNVVMFLK